MSKGKISEPERVELIWLDWFQTLKLNKPTDLVIFFKVLGDFIEFHPDIASHLTIETLHGILLEEI